MKITRSLFLLASALSPTLQAEQARTLGETLCAAQEKYEKADADLNKTYQHIIKSMQNDVYQDGLVDKTALKKTLIKSQTKWLAYRDSHCEAYYTFYSGGTSRNVDRLICLAEETEKRAQQLSNLYDVPHG
jgi:uncharacterized protein YecT (DUF1311 family)